ncbi:hypothetical protein F53441_14451, partial [Fusarium austroafricanum]
MSSSPTSSPYQSSVETTDWDLEDFDEQTEYATSPGEDMEAFADDEKCADEAERLDTHGYGRDVLIDGLVLYSINLRRSSSRKDSLGRFIRGDDSRTPAIIAVQDVSNINCFSRLANYNAWMPGLGTFTEDDYDLAVKQRSRVNMTCLAKSVCNVAAHVVNSAAQALAAEGAPTHTTDTLRRAFKCICTAQETLSDPTMDSYHDIKNAVSSAIGGIGDALKTIPDAQDATPSIQTPLFDALERLSTNRRCLTGVQRGLSSEPSNGPIRPEDRLRAVGFYVHESIPTSDWRVETCTGDNEDI